MANFTTQDIAKKTGLPEIKVIQVIDSIEGTKAEEKDKIFSAMMELNFELNNEIKNQKPVNKGIIAAVTAYFFGNIFPSQVLYGIKQKSEQAGMNLYQYMTRNNYEYQTMLLTRVLKEIKPAALIYVCLKPEIEVLNAFKKSGIPAVIVDEAAEGYSTITIDNFKGGYIATQHLIKTGKKKIGFVSGLSEHYVTQFRYAGYKKALEDAGLAPDKKSIFEVLDYSFDDGKLAMNYFYDKGIKIDAIFCAAGDMTAMGMMKRAKELDIKMPQDIAIVGYDNIEISQLTNPSLTTIEQPIVEMGEKAFEVATAFKDKILKEPYDIKFEPKLIKRDSA